MSEHFNIDEGRARECVSSEPRQFSLSVADIEPAHRDTSQFTAVLDNDLFIDRQELGPSGKRFIIPTREEKAWSECFSAHGH
jgi:hypothetical protein